MLKKKKNRNPLKIEISIDEDEGEASATQPMPRGMLNVLKKGLGLYYLETFVVGLVTWCGRRIGREMRYTNYGRQDGVGEAGKGYHHG